jgi:mycothiol synthase
MIALTVRPYSDENDLKLIVDFLNACEATDREDNFYSVIDLKTGFSEPGFDPAQNVCLWEDAAHLVAYADLWTPTEPVDVLDGHLWFRVHPTKRNRGLEADILAWAETRIREINTKHQLPSKLIVSCRNYQTERIQFYEQNGFQYERCFLKMERRLSEPIPQPQFPEGFQVVQVNGTEDAAAWIEMHRQTFIDHWDFHPYTLEEYSYQISTPKYCPDLDLVAVAPDGTFAAFCYSHIDAEQNQQQQRREGWISSLGTRRGFRRLGLGRAMLLTGLQRLQQAGMEIAYLGVDTANPNHARTLYESVGFRKVHANLFYAKPIA